jgi:hypothetical protein
MMSVILNPTSSDLPLGDPGLRVVLLDRGLTLGAHDPRKPTT